MIPLPKSCKLQEEGLHIGGDGPENQNPTAKLPRKYGSSHPDTKRSPKKRRVSWLRSSGNEDVPEVLGITSDNKDEKRKLVPPERQTSRNAALEGPRRKAEACSEQEGGDKDSVTKGKPGEVFVLIALPSSYNDHGQSKAEECQLFSDLTSVYPFNVESGTVFDERVFAFVPSVKSCCSVASSSTSTTLSTYAPNGISFSGQGGTTTMRSPMNPFLLMLQVFVLIALPSSYNDHGQSKAEECQLFSDLTSVYPFNVESGTVFDERVFAFVPSVKSCCSVASSSTSTTLSTYAPNGISFSGQGGTTTMRSPTNPFLFLLQEWAKDHDYRYSWHKNGKIFLRRKEGDAVVAIKCEADLQRLT
ncbi:hypothetical protein ISCGN_028316 [Ixodes scapularis]